MERWGALSVKDHMDARALAAEVLLYDRLIVPEPQVDHLNTWPKDWDLTGLYRRLDQLGDDLAYRAVWSGDLREEWRRNWSRVQRLVFDARLVSEAKSQQAALALTRMILSMRHPVKPAAGGVIPEVVAVYRSSLEATLPVPDGMSPEGAVDYVVGVRLLAPDDVDGEDALKRAIDIARDNTFRQRRQCVQAWQRRKIQEWTRSGAETVTTLEVEKAMRELDERVRAYNEVVRRNTRKRRIEVAILTGSIAASAVALAAGVAPAAFGALSAGAVAGADVVKFGGFGASSLLQVKKHRISAAEPDSAARVPVVGAMFHQVEYRQSWRARLLNFR